MGEGKEADGLGRTQGSGYGAASAELAAAGAGGMSRGQNAYTPHFAFRYTLVVPATLFASCEHGPGTGLWRQEDRTCSSPTSSTPFSACTSSSTTIPPRCSPRTASCSAVASFAAASRFTNSVSSLSTTAFSPSTTAFSPLTIAFVPSQVRALISQIPTQCEMWVALSTASRAERPSARAIRLDD